MNSDLLLGWSGIVDRMNSDLLAALDWSSIVDRTNYDLLAALD